MTSEVVARLDTLIRLTAIGLCANKTQTEKILLLNSAGLSPKEIAELIGTTRNSVSVALSAIKRKGVGTVRRSIKTVPGDNPDE
jgi:DNA-binding CsgD family transcriptional regulator